MRRVPRRPYKPKPTDAGRSVTWTETGPNGIRVERTGTVWSRAEGTAMFWVRPDEGPGWVKLRISRDGLATSKVDELDYAEERALLDLIEEIDHRGVVVVGNDSMWSPNRYVRNVLHMTGCPEIPEDADVRPGHANTVVRQLLGQKYGWHLCRCLSTNPPETSGTENAAPAAERK